MSHTATRPIAYVIVIEQRALNLTISPLEIELTAHSMDIHAAIAPLKMLESMWEGSQSWPFIRLPDSRVLL